MITKSWRSILVSSAAIAITLTGCYVDDIKDDRAEQIGDAVPNHNPPDNDHGTCRKTIAKGCFDGHVVTKSEFRVDGKTFFDANELASEFCELVVLDDNGDKLAACKVGTIDMAQPIDNDNFSQGFEYLLTGDSARTGKVQNNGNFSLNELPEGLYDLRVQKSLKFVLKYARTVEVPDVDGAEPTTAEEQMARSVCATLYFDTQLDVRRGAREFGTFSDYQLHYGEGDCNASQSSRVLSLNP